MKTSTEIAAGEGRSLERPVDLNRPPRGAASLPQADSEPMPLVELSAPYVNVVTTEERAATLAEGSDLPAPEEVNAKATGGERIELCGSVTLETLRQAQSRDAVITRIKTLLTEADSPLEWSRVNDDNAEVRSLFAQRQTLEMRQGLLYRQFQKPDGTVRFYQAVIPRSLQPTILSQIHDSKLSGHLGLRSVG